MKYIPLAILTFSLAACGSENLKSYLPDIVKVPVSQPCQVTVDLDARRADAFADTPAELAAAADIAGRARLKNAGQKQRDARILELETALRGCAGVLPSSSAGS